jgi:acyl carrier protein
VDDLPATPRAWFAARDTLALFLNAGDPAFDVLERIVLALDEEGVDCLELAVPFPDSPTDGPTIRRSARRAPVIAAPPGLTPRSRRVRRQDAGRRPRGPGVRLNLRPAQARRYTATHTTTHGRKPRMTQTRFSREAVERRISQALVEFGVVADASVSLDATWEGIDVDSLDLAELAQIIDDEYGVEIRPRDMAQLKTVGDAVDMVVATSA